MVSCSFISRSVAKIGFLERIQAQLQVHQFLIESPMDENENDDLDLGINDAAVVSAVREEVDNDRRLRIKPPASAAAASPNLVLVDTGRDPFPLLLVGKKLMMMDA